MARRLRALLLFVLVLFLQGTATSAERIGVVVVPGSQPFSYFGSPTPHEWLDNGTSMMRAYAPSAIMIPPSQMPQGMLTGDLIGNLIVDGAFARVPARQQRALRPLVAWQVGELLARGATRIHGLGFSQGGNALLDTFGALMQENAVLNGVPIRRIPLTLVTFFMPTKLWESPNGHLARYNKVFKEHPELLALSVVGSDGVTQFHHFIGGAVEFMLRGGEPALEFNGGTIKLRGRQSGGFHSIFSSANAAVTMAESPSVHAILHDHPAHPGHELPVRVSLWHHGEDGADHIEGATNLGRVTRFLRRPRGQGNGGGSR